MEKIHAEQSATTQISDLKAMVASDMAAGSKDIDLGQILEVETSPQLERKVLAKIDFMSVPSARLYTIGLLIVWVLTV
jgi:hypothetical protein